MSRASSLHRLQDIDLEIGRRKARLDEIDIILSNSEAINRCRQSLSEAELELGAARAATKGSEHAVALQRQKIEQTEAKLYGGSITNPKELQDLQMESESLKRYLVTLEDRLLEGMVEQEEAEIKHEAVAEELVRLKDLLAVQNRELLAERESIALALERLGMEREAAEASVAEEDLHRYRQLKDRLGDLVVALLEDGACSACGLTLAASIQQTIRTGGELVLCPQCGRVIYAG